MCRLPEKGRKEREERVEEMKERDREERGTGMKVKKQKKYMFYDAVENYLVIIIKYCEGSIILKNRHFIIQERFNKLIYDINAIIKCGS